MRNCRGAVATHIRAEIFVVCKLPKITMAASSTKIAKWKKLPRVTEAYRNLWNADDTGLVMVNKIIMKAMPKKDKKDCLTPSIISFALAVCCIILNPNNNEIRCNEDAIKTRSFW